MNEAIQPERLSDFRGAPFPGAVTSAAVDSIRKQCGWHIAPERADEDEIESVGGKTIYLPTLHLAEVLEIRDADNPDAEPFDGKLRVKRKGIVEALSGRFPDFALVKYRHGYDEFPDALLPIVADRAGAAKTGRIQSESLASRSVTMSAGVDPLTAPLIAAYKVGRRAS